MSASVAFSNTSSISSLVTPCCTLPWGSSSRSQRIESNGIDRPLALWCYNTTPCRRRQLCQVRQIARKQKATELPPRSSEKTPFSACRPSAARPANVDKALGELALLPKRVWRVAKRIGEERVEECRQAATEYEKLLLPAQRQSPSGQLPQVACVQMDGG